MLNQLIDNLDDKLYPKWKVNADSVLAQIEKGLSYYEFNPPVNEIIEIKNAIENARKATAKKDYLAQLDILQQKIEHLATKENFTPPELNQFFFQTRRALGFLATGKFLVSYLKAVNQILDPSRDVRENSEPGFIQKKAVKYIGTTTADSLTDETYFKENVTNFLNQAIDALPKPKTSPTVTSEISSTEETASTVLSETPSTKETAPNALVSEKLEAKSLGPPPVASPFFAQKLSSAQIALLKSPIKIANAQDVSRFLGEQIYGIAFESTYMQVASLYDALFKANQLAANQVNIDKAEEKRKEILEKYGVATLGTAEGLAYLDTLAKSLGFKNAQELYSNYNHLDKEQAFHILMKHKYAFMEYANNPSRGHDPVEKIKNANQIQYEKNKTEAKSNSFQKNHFFVSAINHHMDIIGSLETAKRKKIITELLPQSGWANWGAWILNKVISIDQQAFGGIYAEQTLFDRKLQEFRKPIEEQSEKFVSDLLKEHEQRRKNILNKISSYKTDEELFENLYARKKNVEIAEKAALQDKEENTPLQAVKEKNFFDLSNEYFGFKQAFELKESAELRKKSLQEIDDYIQERKTTVEHLNEDIHLCIDSISNKKVEIDAIKAELEKVQKNIEDFRQDKSFGGRLKRMGVGFLSLFRYKTEDEKTKIRLEEHLANLNSELSILEERLDRNNFKQKMETERWLQAEDRKRFHEEHDVKNLSAKALLVETNLYLKDMESKYKNISSSNSLERALKAQEMFLEHENQTQFIMDALLTNWDKLLQDPNLTASKVGNFLRNVTAIKNTCENFKRDLVGWPPGTDKPALINKISILETKLQSLYKEKNKKVADNLVERAKNRVSDILGGKDLKEIRSPFSLVNDNFGYVFEGFSNSYSNNVEMSNQVWDHVKETYKKLLKEQASSMEKKDLEKIYLGFKALSLASKSSNEVKSYYGELAIMVAPELEKNTPTNLISFDQELQRISELAHEAITKRETAESWVWNFLGTTSVENAKNYEKAAIDYFSDFSKKYSEATPGFYQRLSHSELTKHIENLESCMKLLEEIEEKSKNSAVTEIKAQFTNLIETANKASTNHVYHQIIGVPEIFSNIGNTLQEAQELQEKIESTASKKMHFVDEDYRQYSQLVSELSAQVGQLEASIESIDHQFLGQGIDEDHSNSDYRDWQESKKSHLENLKQAAATLKSMKENAIPKFDFYEQISQKGTISVNLSALDKETVGQGLLLAIEYGNMSALQTILQAKILDESALAKGLFLAASIKNSEALQHILAARKFSLSSLEEPLKAVSMHGDFESMERLYTHRKDAVFRQEVIDQCIQNAFMNIPAENVEPNESHRQIIHYLVLNSEVAPERLREIAEGMSAKGTIGLTKITWKGIDNDYENLVKIRNYFIFESELLDSLDQKFESLSQAAAKISDNKDPNYQKVMEEISKFYEQLDKIGAMRKSYLDYFSIEDEDRRDRVYISETWEKEMPHTLSGYREALDKQASRIFNASIPTMETTFVEETVEPVNKAVIESDKGKEEIGIMEEVSDEIEDDVSKQEKVEPLSIPISSKPPFNFKSTQAELTRLLSFDSTNTDKIKKLLKKYWKNCTTEEQQSDFYAFTSNAINEVAKKDKETPEALWALLSSIKDPDKKEENIRNAFFVAISHGQHKTVQFLCSKGLHEKFKSELFEHLHSVIEKRRDQQYHEKGYFQVASALLTSNVVEPSVENQPKIADVLEVSASEISPVNSKYTEISGTWGALVGSEDKDRPFLNNMRNLYIHSDNAFYHLAEDAELMYHDEVMRGIQDYTPEQIKVLEEKIALWEKEWDATSTFKVNYSQFLAPQMDSSRLNSYLASASGWFGKAKGWDEQFNDDYKTNEEKFRSSIEEMREAIQVYHKQQEKRVKPVLSSFSEKEKLPEQKPKSVLHESHTLEKQNEPTTKPIKSSKPTG